ncbi:MAG TPA: hypothetical protein ENK48_05655 [Gammaproteobacteria bacterium]|nr:hypothetical protein [Gammaproteobacteria bacterium]
MKKVDFRGLFERVVGVVFAVILVIIILGIIIGVSQLLHTLGGMVMHKVLGRDYLELISEVLTLFILIELSRSLVDYFDNRRLRMTFIVDAAIVFVLREIMIKLFEHKITVEEIYALSALLLVMSLLRIGSYWMYQKDFAIRGQRQSRRESG